MVGITNAKDLKELLYKEGYFYFKATKTANDSIAQYTIALGKPTNTILIQGLPKNIQKYIKSKKTSLVLRPKEVSPWIENVKQYFDERGENFSEIQLTNLIVKNDTLLCKLSIKKSEQRNIDRIVIKGYQRFSKSFLRYYIKSKKPFSKDLLKNTEEKINQLNFVKNTKAPGVLFTKDSTHLYLYLTRIKANKLDALLGFTTEDNGKLQFNGHVDISLVNALHKGESFAFQWKNNGQEQETFHLNLESPYIFKTPINFGYQLNIFKQDSTFVNTKNRLSLSYQPHYKHTLSSYYQTESSTVLAETSPLLGYQKSFVGFTYLFKEVNNLKLPKVQFGIDYAFGSREQEGSNTQQQTLQTNAIYNIELSANNHLFLQNRSAYLLSNNKTTNELFRTGGATTLRGFLEQSIFAHLYSYANLEYRFFTNTASYLYGFSDYGYFKNLAQENRLLSLGVGYTFATRGGLLKISYAVGKSNESDFDLNTGLFHVNFVTLF
ncbi:hypothetical protein [Wenyingzhuangia sp. IMCC45574]